MKSLNITLALRLLWRNWRSGEIKILAMSLALAVAVVTAIAVFTDRMQQSLVRQSNSYLAADRVVESRFAIPTEWRNAVNGMALTQTDIAEFSSVVFAAGSDEGAAVDMQLASIKAVGQHYPLRGEVEVSRVAFGSGDAITRAQGIPTPGEVWVDSRLLPLLQLSLGDKLAIGNRDFTISQLVIREPDAANGFNVLGPRVLMNLADLDSTGVILPGSRVDYRWLVAGEVPALAEFERWLQPQLGEHYRLVGLREAQQNIGLALERGGRFLMLAGMIGVLLACVAVSIASQQFAQRHIDQVALIKSLGISALQVRQLYFMQLLLLGLFASLLGILAGEGIQRLIAASIASLFNIQLLAANAAVYFVGLATGLLCLLCFALPPLWQLPKVSPLKVLRRELSASLTSRWVKGLIGIAALLLFIGVISRDSTLTLAIAGGIGAMILVTGLLAILLLNTGHYLGSKAGSVWRLALANLRRYQGQTVTQVLVFACALMLLMVLFAVRTNLIDEWRLQLPEDAPNHFVMNIAPYEKTDIETLFNEKQLQTSPLYPMVLGRLTGVNEYNYQDKDRGLSNALRRELNLSWSATMAPDNQLLAGQWWDDWQSTSGARGVSVEADTAKELSLNIGDQVHFSLGGLSLTAEVASIRSVDWNALTPNFYFLFSPGTLADYSPNYLTSVHIPAEQKNIINSLLRDYPTIVVIEVDRIIERIRAIVNQVSRSIELVLWLVLLGGILVLIAAVNASMASRMQEAGILRALGSGKRLIMGSLWLEFSILGLCAGILAVLGAEALLLSLQAFVFDQPIRPHYLLWWLGPTVGAILIGCLGLLACRKTVTVAPARVLRELEG